MTKRSLSKNCQSVFLEIPAASHHSKMFQQLCLLLASLTVALGQGGFHYTRYYYHLTLLLLTVVTAMYAIVFSLRPLLLWEKEKSLAE
jgi:hypothetical protein